MTLTRYIFLIVVVFLLLVATIQIVLIQNAQQQITLEISDKSQTLSEVALQALENQVFLPNTEQKTIRIKIEAAPQEVVDLGDGYVFVSGQDSQLVTVEAMRSGSASFSTQNVSTASHQSHVVEFPEVNRTSNYTFSVGFSGDNDRVSTQRIVQFDRESSSVSQFLDQLVGVTAILTLAGIGFAYLLARHISAPLRKLSTGLSAISEGQLGKRVEEKGIAEVKQTLHQFNHMSQRLEKAQELEQRFQQQQQLAELGDVAKGLAHSLRNPLNTIGLTLEQMTMPDLSDAERQQLAEQARTKISHMDHSVKQLLNLATVDIQREEHINVNDVLTDVVLELSLTSPIKINVDAPNDVQMQGAETELRTILHVLLSNAVEASPHDGEIQVNVDQQQNTVSVLIADQGGGISEHIRSKLFSPHITTKAEGAGMGLFIARRIARSYYQGDITLENKAEKGCEATLTLLTQRPQ